MAYIPPSTWLSSAAKWLSEPGNQNLLAGVGAKLDPQGIGGALGTATVGYNQSRVAAARAETQEKLLEDQRQSALKLLQLTPPGTPGTTKIEARPDGNIVQTSDVGKSSVVTPPPAPIAPTVPPVTATPAAAATGTSAAPTQMPAMTVTAQREPPATPSPYSTTANVGQFDVRQIAPFLLSPGSRGSLSGLTPEQINAIRNTENETERLRLSSFGNIIQGEEVRSQINYREAAGQLTKAQADVLRAQQPHVVPKMLADIDQSQAAAAASRQQVKRGETLLPIEARKGEAEIQREQAGTALANAQANRVKELVQFEKDNYTANINQSNKAAGVSAANEERIRLLAPKEFELLQNQVKEYVTAEMSTEPGKKQEFMLKGKDLIAEKDKARDTMIAAYKAREERMRQARTDDRLARKESTDAEQHLRSKLPGGYAILNDESELTPDAEMFHATSKNPYVYILESTAASGLPFSSEGVKMNKRDLPKVDGHQYTAQELYDKAMPLGLTVQQYLEQVFYPKLQQPIPWKSGYQSTLKPPAK